MDMDMDMASWTCSKAYRSAYQGRRDDKTSAKKDAAEPTKQIQKKAVMSWRWIALRVGGVRPSATAMETAEHVSRLAGDEAVPPGAG